MADNKARYGLRWIKSFASDSPRGLSVPIASGQVFAPGSATGADLQKGDPVKLLDPGGATFEDVDLTEAIWGVCVGVKQVFDVVRGVLGPAVKVPSGVVYGTNLERQTQIFVIPAENAVWEIDAAFSLTTRAAWEAIVGQNADLVFTTTAADKNGTPRLAAPTGGGTGAAQMRILGLSPTLENQDLSGANVKLLVEVVETQRAPFNTAGL